MPNATGVLKRVFETAPSARPAPRHCPAYLLAVAFLLVPHPARAQSNAEWTQYKISCGIPASTAYNDWVAQGSPCPKTAAAASSAAPAVPALTPQQQLGMQAAVLGGAMIGQGLHQLLFPTKPVLAPPDPAEQQRELAAAQLNNSGLYLLKQKNYRGAINEFQKALALFPNDSNTLHNLALAKQKLQDADVAGQTSGSLAQFLRNTPANSGNFNLDHLSNSSVGNPNSSPLGLVDLGSDPHIVDLRGTKKTSVDPELLKTQLDGVLTNTAPEPARSLLVLPQDKDIELLSILSQSGASQSQVVLPQEKDVELLSTLPQSATPQPQVVPPQDKDIELLSTLPQSATPQSQVVLPQDKDMELLGSPTPVPAAKPAAQTGEPQKKAKPAAINTAGKPGSAPQAHPGPPATATPPNPTSNN